MVVSKNYRSAGRLLIFTIVAIALCPWFCCAVFAGKPYIGIVQSVRQADIVVQGVMQADDSFKIQKIYKGEVEEDVLHISYLKEKSKRMRNRPPKPRRKGTRDAAFAFQKERREKGLIDMELILFLNRDKKGTFTLQQAKRQPPKSVGVGSVGFIIVRDNKLFYSRGQYSYPWPKNLSLKVFEESVAYDRDIVLRLDCRKPFNLSVLEFRILNASENVVAIDFKEKMRFLIWDEKHDKEISLSLDDVEIRHMVSKLAPGQSIGGACRMKDKVMLKYGIKKDENYKAKIIFDTGAGVYADECMLTF